MCEEIGAHVRVILETYATRREAQIAKVREVEAAGGRIVTGGQTSQTGWEILDWRTDEVLAKGDSGLEGFEETWSRLDPNDLWWDFDTLTDGLDLYEKFPVPDAEGVPPSLAEALEDWIGRLCTPDEDIAEIAGLSVERVEYCRGEGPDKTR